MSDYDGILQEEMNDKLDIILEYLEPLAPVPARLTGLENDVSEVKDDIKVIKIVVTDLSKTVSSHEGRLTKLETA